MPKIKDFFTRLKDQGKMKSEDYDKFLASVPDAEIPDTVISTFESEFLTRERAKADDDIQKHFKAQIYNTVDARILEDILPVIDPFEATKIQKEGSTIQRLKMLPAAINDVVTRAKKSVSSSSEEKDKDIATLKAQVSEFEKKFPALKTEYETKMQDLEKKSKEELHLAKLNYSIKSQIAEYDLADEWKTKRDVVTRTILTEVTGNGNHLTLSDDGQVEVFEMKDGVPTPKFDGNNRVIFKNLLDKAADPFLKKNNREEGKPKTTQTKTTEPFTGKETLAQMRARQRQSATT